MKRHCISGLVFGVLAAVGLAGCVPYPFTSAAMPAIHGTVREAGTGNPIEGVEVASERYGHRRHTVTKADGSYALPSLSQRHYFVYLGSPGIFPTPWRFEYSFTDPILVTAQKAGCGTIRKRISDAVLQSGKETLFSESYVPVALDFALRRGVALPLEEITVFPEATKAGESSVPPRGIPVPGKPGFVTSPWAPSAGYIDVREFPSGAEVRCPYTGKVFLAP